MTFTKKQNDDLCVKAGIAPVDYIGKSVECTTCRCTKKPRGRSAPYGASYCDTDCSGYWEAPLSGDLWWDETGTDFGYAFSRELANPVYPDLLTAEGFLILWRALSDLGYNVKVSTKQKYTTTVFVGNATHSRELKTTEKDIPKVLFVCSAKLLGVSLD